MLFSPRFKAALLALMEINTVTPMEDGTQSDHRRANQVYAALAEEIGMKVVFSGEGQLPEHADANVPLMIKRCMTAQPDFLARQPHLILELGHGDVEHTLMFNFHMDTVAPHLPVSMEDGVVRGRGAVDNKGPAIALLVALDQLRQRHPNIFATTRVLIMAVGGEEGGAMGVYGTRYLVTRGFIGRLNVFVEPSDGSYFDASTTSMTYEVSFDGRGATDDFPEQGENATLTLAYLAQYMAASMSQTMAELAVKMTVAGLHTGHHHNRVYGEGRLLFNFAYANDIAAQAAQQAVDAAFDSGVIAFSAKFKDLSPFMRSAACVREVCHGRWLKRNLPVLNNRHPELEALLGTVGLLRNADISEAFTCDAMWAQRPDAYSIVFGPGSLGANGAHTDDEFISIANLEDFADTVAQLIVRFADPQTPNTIHISDSR